jgi:alkaline phosphatase D
VRKHLLMGCLAALGAAAAGWAAAGEPTAEPVVARVAFGSCAHQDKPQPIWDAIVEAHPDLFLFIGDNIYADTTDADLMRQKYETLAAIPGFQRLRAACPVRATWDDHDYGLNDAGAEFAFKDTAQQIFLDFLDVPADSPRRAQAGVYSAEMFGPEDQRVQVILLDTRYFRGPMVRKALRTPGEGPYQPTTDPSATVLGEIQWQWLEEQLRQPARLRVIASSIQLLSGQHGWESWGLFPRERQRFSDLLDRTGAAGVIVISGDRHHGELSRAFTRARYPVHDLTSSGLNQLRGRLREPNRYRIGDIFWNANFGWIEVDWAEADPAVRLSLHDVDGQPVLQHTVRLSELKPAR